MGLKNELIEAMNNIDREALLEKNPRRPFDNQKTLDLFSEEVMWIIEDKFPE